MKQFKNSKRTISEIEHNENYNIIYNDAENRFNAASDLFTKAECLSIMIALNTGLRVSDLLRLKWEVFSFDKSIKGYVCISYVKKTDLKGHTTRIDTSTYNYIKEYKEFLVASYGVLSDNVFYNYKNKSFFTRIWLSKRTTLRYNFTFHNLRKISAKKILEVGTIANASKHLAHKKVSTTDAYLKVSEDAHLNKISDMYN